MTFSLRIYLITIAVMIAIAIGYGEIRYMNGWFTHSAKVNADYELKKQKAEAKLVPTEQKAAAASADGKVIYRTITRNVVTYVQNPNRTLCNFDDDAIRLRQQAVDAANHISGFDEPAVQAQPGGKKQ
ncbi:hypothetical protein ABEG75_11495 [Pantoea agglomerans]|uniref:hypothetical protein n=1 Tax=Enterobacter agglomerans TaxID=549 RepID=UPI0004D5ECF7|nr:hypothetical protein [Pantoea agglomerans]KEY43394.1 hypothetical protein FB99_18460 [Pantoea agglomerans]QAV44770.1 hypothetical protein D1629_09080 [Pantoea agglomerans]QAV49610.1 hypothetical protein D1628_10090 [Pantoea agglomerans]